MNPRTWNIGDILRRRRHQGRLLGALALLALAISGWLVGRLVSLSPRAGVTISAGNTEGIWYRYLLNFVHHSANPDLPLSAVITSGTLDMLERVDRGELDFALVTGGYDFNRYPHVRQAAALSILPLHLLVKPELYDAASRDFGVLRGKTINLGSGRRTGTYWLSREVLSFAGLPPTEYRASDMTSEQLRAIDDPKRLPDAIFIVTRPPSGLVDRLVQRFGFRLVALPFGQAFRATALAGQEPVPPDGIAVQKAHIPDTIIPAYSYAVSPPVPAQDLPTLGSRLLLVCAEKVPARTVYLLLDAFIETPFAHLIEPPLTPDIVKQAAEAPWHQGAIDYRQRDQPVVTGELIDILSNSLQLMLPLGGGVLLLWGWLRTRVLTDRERRIDRFIALISGVEQRALQLGQERPIDHRSIQSLHQELSTIKDAALEKIAKGEAGSPLLVSTLFSHLSDVRAYLTELERSETHESDSQRGVS